MGDLFGGFGGGPPRGAPRAGAPILNGQNGGVPGPVPTAPAQGPQGANQGYHGATHGMAFGPQEGMNRAASISAGGGDVDPLSALLKHLESLVPKNLSFPTGTKTGAGSPASPPGTPGAGMTGAGGNRTPGAKAGFPTTPAATPWRPGR